RAAVVEHDQLVDVPGVVAHERLDDVDLVPDPGDSDELHSPTRNSCAPAQLVSHMTGDYCFGRGRMRKIYLESPLLQGQTATFRWRVEPASELYRQTHFSLHFPHSVDLSAVPERLWWDVLLICLHAHWLVLRPCEVHLPLRLGDGERQFWLEH